MVSVMANDVVFTRTSGDLSSTGTSLKWNMISSDFPSVSPLRIVSVHFCLKKAYQMTHINVCCGQSSI